MNTTKTIQQKLNDLIEQRQKTMMELREQTLPRETTLKKLRKIEKETKDLEFQSKMESIETELQHTEECLKLVPEIEKVLNKFNLKKSGKKFKDDLKQIDNNLYWYSQYNSWYIKHYKYDINIVSGCIRSGYGDGIEQNGVIIAEIAIKELNKFVEYSTKRIENVRKQNNIETINSFIEERDNLLKQIEIYNKKIEYDMRDKFKLYIESKTY